MQRFKSFDDFQSFVRSKYGPDKVSDLDIATYWAEVPQVRIDPVRARSVGEVAGDLGASVMGGFGNVVEGAGALAGLTGLADMDNPVRQAGADAAEYWQSKKSDPLKELEARRAENIAAAENQGIGHAFWAGIKETASDPALLSSFLAEQLPNFLVGGIAGRAAGGAASAIAGSAGATSARGVQAVSALGKLAPKVGTAGAVGSMAGMQAADVGGDTYDRMLKLPDEVWLQNDDFIRLLDDGADPQEAKQLLALDVSRKAAGAAGLVSLASMMVPGGTTIERLVAGAGRGGRGIVAGAAKGFLGEGAQEAIEEGGGAFSSNLAEREVNPNVDLGRGVGSAAGQGFVVGGPLGGAAGGVESLVDAPRVERVRDITQRGLDDIAAADNIDGAIAATENAVLTPLQLPAPGPILRPTEQGLAPSMIAGPEGVRPERVTDLTPGNTESARFATPMDAEAAAQSAGVLQTAQNAAGAAQPAAPTNTAPSPAAAPTGAPVAPQTASGTVGYVPTITPAGEFAIRRTDVAGDSAQLAREIESINRQEAQASAAGQEQGKVGGRFGARLAPHEMVRGGSAIVGALEMIGAKVRFFTSDTHAAMNGFFGSDGTIWINARAKSPLNEVAFHEADHYLERFFPELHAEYKAAQRTFITDAQRAQIRKDYGARGNVEQEALANISGAVTSRPEFWSHLKETSPAAFGKIVESVQRFFRDLIAKLAGSKGHLAKLAERDAKVAAKNFADLIAKAEQEHRRRVAAAPAEAAERARQAQMESAAKTYADRRAQEPQAEEAAQEISARAMRNAANAGVDVANEQYKGPRFSAAEGERTHDDVPRDEVGRFATKENARLPVGEHKRADGATPADRQRSMLSVSPEEIKRIARRDDATTADRSSFTAGGVENLPNERGWAVLTAEDPNNTKATAAYNKAAMDELRAWLRREGVDFIEVEGNYDGIQNSLVVYGRRVDAAFAERARARFEQESVLIPEGLLYAEGALDPATGTSQEAPDADNYYTVLPDGTKWQYGIDFEHRTQLSVAPDGEASERGILPAARKIAAGLKHEPIREQSAKNTAYLVREMRKIVDAEVATGHGAEHWYRDSMKRAMAAVETAYPEVATNPDARDAFIAALAITSNGLSIPYNVDAAFQTFEYWREHGRMPEEGFPIYGVRVDNIVDGLRKYNLTIEELGPEGAREFWSSKMTNKEMLIALDGIQQDNKIPKGFEVYGSAMFGPKIGHGFYSNLSGRLDVVTMDRWFWRTWGRLTNTLIRERAGKEFAIENAAGPREWAFAHDTVVELVRQEREAGRDITAADAQAILWYAEKKLYDSLGAANELAKPTDYPTEIERYLDEHQPGWRDAGGAESRRGRGAERNAERAEDARTVAEDQDASIPFSIAAGPAEPAVRSGAGGRPDAVEVVGVHYGKSNTPALSGRMFGTGIRGAEQERLKYARDERIKRRVYFYVGKEGAGLPPAEHGLGPWVYRANLGNLWESGKSAKLTFEKPEVSPGVMDWDAYNNNFESAVLDAGYDGYVNRDAGRFGIAVVLNKDVPVELLGNRAQEKIQFSIDDSADEYLEGAPAPEDDTIGVARQLPEKIGEDVADYRKQAKLKRDAKTLRALGAAWLDLAQDRSLFKFTDTIDSELENVAYDMSDREVRVKGPRPPNKFERTIRDFGLEVKKVYDLKVGGANAYVYEDKNGRVVLNVAALEQGKTKGALVYQIVAQWAANAGKTFIGDPVSITTRALFRRAINMMSSALRVGGTSHLEPHPDQVDAGLAWRKGDDAFNIGSMAAWVRDTIALYAPQTYDPDFDAADPYRGLGAFRPSAGVPPEQAAGGEATKSQVRTTDRLLAELAQGARPRDAAAATDVGDREGALDSVRDRLVERPTLYSVDPFYSELARQVEKSPTAAAPAAGWQSLITGLVNKGLVKRDEVEWSGIDEWLKLQGKKVTKADVLDFLRGNGVRVEETVLGERPLPEGFTLTQRNAMKFFVSGFGVEAEGNSAVDAAINAALYAESLARDWQREGDTEKAERYFQRAEALNAWAESADGHGAAGEAKHASHQLPGGQNYRELLLTLPYNPQGEKTGNLENFRSTHFDQPNILAHVRFNERTDADGKRVLFIEEIQSDWAQQFRKYADENTGDLATALRQVDKNRIPPAPFVTKTDAWVSLALKRMIRWAAENGFDRVAWTTGEQQAARYDLSKHIDELRYRKDPHDGKFDLFAKTRERGDITIGEGIPPAKLDDFVGKEVAQRIRDLEGKPVKRTDAFGKEQSDLRSLSGLDLKVGGEGMHTFYDQIVPKVANDVLKKLDGGRVTDVRVEQLFEPDEVTVDARGNEIAVRRSVAQPGFDITPALRERALGGLPLFSISSEGLAVNMRSLRDGVLDTIGRDQFFGRLWDKTIGTKMNLALKDADFRRVFEETQAYLDDTSRIASQVADLAPDLLPKMHRFTDAFKGAQGDFTGQNAADITAASKALLDGTIEDRVYKDEELRERGLSDRQIRLYREARRAVNDSLDRLAVSEMYRLTRGVLPDGVRERLKSMHAAEAAETIAGALGTDTATIDIVKAVRDKTARVNHLKATGYFPLMRFGRYAIDFMIQNEDGKTEHGFLMFESQVKRNAAARELQALGATDMKIGEIPSERYKLFRGMDPNSLELFGEVADIDYLDENGKVVTMKLADDEMFQQYIRLAANNRSTMKRLLKRKKVAGFSEDGQRALASLITSNARAASSNYHLYEMSSTAAAIDKNKGDVVDEAVKLVKYVTEGQEEAGRLRGLLFINFLGGSVASALVNMTQPITMTLPYLAKWGGSVTTMTDAVTAVLGRRKLAPELAAALKRAEEEGEVEPHEIHNLYAESSRNFGGDIRVRRLLHLWGSFFSAAEAFNRRVTFVAAWNVAQRLAPEELSGGAYEFAIQAVRETQGIYNKGNRPNWARGPVGATLFTFKQYSIAYLEFLNRLPRKQKLIALGILVLLSGVQGLPFADDLDDLIDTFGQQLGYATNTKLWKRQALHNALGKAMGDILLYGVSSIPGVPLDVQGRMSMGNLIPGSDLFKRSNTDAKRSALEILGPAGALGNQLIEGFTEGKLSSFAPVAIQNALKGGDMLATGMYRDRAGKNVVGTTAGDAITKIIGFQPHAVADVMRATTMVNESVKLVKAREKEIAETWAEGVALRKPELVREAMADVREWNRANPMMPIKITPQQIARRVKEMLTPRDQRIAKTAPKEIRGAVRQQLNEL